MNKRSIAVIFGGYSAEYRVSLSSAKEVLENIDKEKYNIVPIGITEKGEWFHYLGASSEIEKDNWHTDEEKVRRCTFSHDPKRKGFYERCNEEIVFVPVDMAFPVLHGKNGEDGTVQAIFELADIPIIGCKASSSALCMDKHRAHKVVNSYGICVPHSIGFEREEQRRAMGFVKENFIFPVFVKPVRGGSSIGMSKVYSPTEVESAIEKAFLYDREVMIEEEVAGFEVGCAIIGDKHLTVGVVDEIELQCSFFDYTEKYTQNHSVIHLPARISEEKAKEIKNTAVQIYRALGCSGFARVDLFLTPEGELFFNEVNTIPGMTKHSRFPKMMQKAGISFSEMLELMISEEA